MKINLKIILSAIIITLMVIACNSKNETEDKTEVSSKNPSIISEETKLNPLDISAIEKAINMQGTEKDGEYKVSVPQNDLNVEVDGFKIIPPMGLGSWAAFAPARSGTMLMGDIVVTEDDLKPVQQEIIRQGLTITAIHNHFVRNHPNVMYMHIGGMGSEEKLAEGVKAVFAKVEEVRGGNPAEAKAEEVESTLDTAMIADILGHSGKMNRGVYKITIGRPDVALKEYGAPVRPLWASTPGQPGKAHRRKQQ